LVALASRLGIAAALGGDYWDTATSIGHTGTAWIGTYEARPASDVPAGTVQGDEPTGTLTSNPFLVTHTVVDFLIGGGAGPGERVELVLHPDDYDALAAGNPPRFADAVEQYRVRAPNPVPIIVGVDDVVPALPPDAVRDALGYVVLTASGHDDERLAREMWRLSTALLGCVAWIRVVDEGTGPWGHLNLDDIRFHD
jgi:hypothetical protein